MTVHNPATDALNLARHDSGSATDSRLTQRLVAPQAGSRARLRPGGRLEPRAKPMPLAPDRRSRVAEAAKASRLRRRARSAAHPLPQWYRGCVHVHTRQGLSLGLVLPSTILRVPRGQPRNLCLRRIPSRKMLLEVGSETRCSLPLSQPHLRFAYPLRAGTRRAWRIPTRLHRHDIDPRTGAARKAIHAGALRSEAAYCFPNKVIQHHYALYHLVRLMLCCCFVARNPICG